MSEYRLVSTKEFVEALEKLVNSVKCRLPKIFEKIKQYPRFSKPLHGKWDYYRVRFLNYRLIYSVNEGEKTIILLDVGKRSRVYGN